MSVLRDTMVDQFRESDHDISAFYPVLIHLHWFIGLGRRIRADHNHLVALSADADCRTTGMRDVRLRDEEDGVAQVTGAVHRPKPASIHQHGKSNLPIHCSESDASGGAC